jgi:hypothetical protein
VAPKEENYPKKKTTQQRRSLYDTQITHVCAVDGILGGGFVLLKKIMLVLWMECLKVVLYYQGKSCSYRDGKLEIGFVVPRLFMFVPWVEC